MTTENNNNLYPDLLTEEELIKFLRIPSVSKANDYHNVISHLKRVHSLPCIHICRQPLYPTEAVRRWIGRLAHLFRLGYNKTRIGFTSYSSAERR